MSVAALGLGSGLAQADPPFPPPPYWAPWLPVEWNWELNTWGVWWNGGFRTH
jgi:hypothetical protein